MRELCASCGRCCSGSVFASTALEGPEQLRFGRRELPQPCPHFGADKRCAIYATRPKACVEYECETLKALKRGVIDLAEAQKRLAALPPGRTP